VPASLRAAVADFEPRIGGTPPGRQCVQDILVREGRALDGDGSRRRFGQRLTGSRLEVMDPLPPPCSGAMTSGVPANRTCQLGPTMKRQTSTCVGAEVATSSSDPLAAVPVPCGMSSPARARSRCGRPRWAALPSARTRPGAAGPGVNAPCAERAARRL
jgi:hypothetical protein